MSPPSRITVGKSLGLHVSWFVYRGTVGATVTFINAREETRTVTILGADEADISRGEVSLYAPIARALLRAQAGDVVRLHTPSGPEEVEVVAICYPGPGNGGPAFGSRLA